MGPLVSVRPYAVVGIAALLWVWLAASSMPDAQGRSPVHGPVWKEAGVSTRGSGTFEVKLNPLPAYDAAEGSPLGRMSIDKQFHGDLEATSKGEMLTGMTSVSGSAGYVAIERVTGTLHTRAGTFILQHSATMTRGEPQLSISVVPDSGTGDLVGLRGTMGIRIAEGKHFYDFDYTLPVTR
jgi:hypothetical protein